MGTSLVVATATPNKTIEVGGPSTAMVSLAHTPPSTMPIPNATHDDGVGGDECNVIGSDAPGGHRD
jgi:hypothetical protein